MNPVVSHEDWLEARKALLAEEKALTRQLDSLRARRLKLPWVKLDKLYIFDTPGGPKTLADLFAGRSQLLIQHFMFSPDWEDGCTGCSLGADHINGIFTHLEHHDVKFAAVSRAPLAKISAFKKRMGWDFDWVSSGDSDFNYDFNVSFREGQPITYNYRDEPFMMEDLPGLSAFYKDEDGQIYHTYSCFARGTELAGGLFGLLDISPKGRNEEGGMMDWLRLRDSYEDAPKACGCGGPN
ncbi:thioredoxin family protein [Asticcacaulis sp. EMRT-3]|uniref:DUF899 domain-containing protein n=1 Tax=Asticcacaulis sp. EMRT-3 TaxID=3040349 RepID=UPI0024AEA6D7|nr:thioredoxin family protein [Asticcacaulis sp. EMRT-3]MDI7774999.1 thioredoxin family protein [Asticcacaulis sp. EMRT-3]